MVKIRALISSAGRRVELINCFREDARRLGIDLHVLAVDLHPELSPACRSADAWMRVPRSTSPEFPGVLREIVEREGVGLLVPTIDTELAAVSRLAPELSRLGCKAVVSSPAVVELARDKYRTQRALEDAGIPTPRGMPIEEYRREPCGISLPLIAKPRGGSSSHGVVVIQSPADLPALVSLGQDYLVQELACGREYTVNAFVDAAGVIRCMVPHERMEVRAGEVSKARTRRLPQVGEMGVRLQRVLAGAYGPVCFQGILTAESEFRVFEVNARFGGGFPVAHRAGARFTQWLLEEHVGRPCSASDAWCEGVTMLRYDAAVFVEPESSV